MRILKMLRLLLSFLVISGSLGDELEKPRFQVDHKSGKLDITATKESADINSTEDYIDVVMKPGEQKSTDDSGAAHQRHNAPDENGPKSETGQGNSTVGVNKNAQNSTEDTSVEYPKVYNSTKPGSENKSLLELEQEAAELAKKILNSSRDEVGLSFIKETAQKLDDKVAELNKTFFDYSIGLERSNLTSSELNSTSGEKSEGEEQNHGESQTEKDKTSSKDDTAKNVGNEEPQKTEIKSSSENNKPEEKLSKVDEKSQRNGSSSQSNIDHSFDLDDAELSDEEKSILGAYKEKNISYAQLDGDHTIKTTGGKLGSVKVIARNRTKGGASEDVDGAMVNNTSDGSSGVSSTEGTSSKNTDTGSKDYNRIEPNITLNETAVVTSPGDTQNRSLSTGTTDDKVKTLQDFEKLLESFLKNSKLEEREQLLKLTWHDLRKQHAGRDLNSTSETTARNIERNESVAGNTATNGSKSATEDVAAIGSAAVNTAVNGSAGSNNALKGSAAGKMPSKGSAVGNTTSNGSVAKNKTANSSSSDADALTNSTNSYSEAALQQQISEAIESGATSTNNNTVAGALGSGDWMKTLVGRLKHKISLLKDAVDYKAQKKLRQKQGIRKNPYEGFKRQKITLSNKMDWLNARFGKLGYKTSFHRHRLPF